MTEPCIFCKIADGSVPASSFYEDNCVVAFLDNRPASDGHTLVIPRKHFETIYDIPGEEIAHLFKVVKRVAVAVRETLSPEGLSIIQRNGKAAGQHILHLHVHVIPRHSSQRLLRMEEIQEADRDKLDKIAKAIQQHISAHAFASRKFTYLHSAARNRHEATLVQRACNQAEANVQKMLEATFNSPSAYTK